MKLLFAGGGTGGHLYPGLAIARAVLRERPDASIRFVGALRGIERDVLPGAGFPYELLDLHPLYRAKPWLNWRTVRGAVSAWRRLGALARAQRPDVVVGTGGYAAGLALAYAAVHGIPYALQEQNGFPGLTMRVAARRAREIWLGYPEAVAHLPASSRAACVDTGNPIEPPPAVRPDVTAARRRWSLPDDDRTLLVFGGSQGARAINEAVGAWLDAGRLPPGVSLLWVTGKGSHAAYARHDGPRVRVVPYVSPMSDAYAAASLAVARSGAMGTAEMCAWGIPQLLVPLPTAAADHQTVNARALAAAGAAVHLPQAGLTVDRLDRELRALLDDDAALARLAANARARARPNAAMEIARRVIAIAEGAPRRS